MIEKSTVIPPSLMVLFTLNTTIAWSTKHRIDIERTPDMKEIKLYECAETTSETTSTFDIFEVIHYDIHRPLLCCQQREEDLGS